MLFFYTELPESTNQHILPGFQGSLDDFQQGFNCVERLFLWIAIFFGKRFGNVGFGEGHKKFPLLNLVMISSVYIYSHIKVNICQENKQVILWHQSND